MESSPKPQPVSVDSLLENDDIKKQSRGSSLQYEPPPRLRRWPRIRQEVRLLFKSVGLGAAVTTYRGLWGEYSEPVKIAVIKSRPTAIVKSLIHSLPVAVALMEIILNWKGHYIGAQFSKQSYYQFAAKAHELVIQASLASIVHSYILYEVSAKGMPFGAFLSGLQFLQLSYLWSTEFWSAILSKDFHLRRKFFLLVLILSCGLIAATAGPSSATLLIPRSVAWPLAPTYFVVNGTFQDIYPDHVEAEGVPDDCAVFTGSTNTIYNGSATKSTCPAADWPAIFRGLESFTSNDAAPFDGVTNTTTDIFGLDSVNGSFLRWAAVDLCTHSSSDQLCATTPQEIVLAGAFNDLIQWTDDYLTSNSVNFVDAFYTIQNDYYQPFTLTSCFSDTIQDANDWAPLRFARISETDSENAAERKIISTTNLPKAQFYEESGNISEYRLHWITLPVDLFSDTAIGSVILFPRDIHGTQIVMTCTSGAGWGTASVFTDYLSPGNYGSYISGVPASFQTVVGSSIGQSIGVPDFANSSGFVFPQRRISISPKWAQFLNPLITFPEGGSTTLFNNYMSVAGTPFGEIATSKIISLMLSSGLSKIGRQLPWQELANNVNQCNHCTVFEVDHSIQGYAYSVNGTLTKIAVAVMIGFCILATAHSVYLATTGLSSATWDSAAEVVALAMNSTPTRLLQNTCAGITSARTFQTRVRVLASDNGNGNGKDEHLELVFGDVPNAKHSLIVENQEYGRLSIVEEEKIFTG